MWCVPGQTVSNVTSHRGTSLGAYRRKIRSKAREDTMCIIAIALATMIAAPLPAWSESSTMDLVAGLMP